MHHRPLLRPLATLLTAALATVALCTPSPAHAVDAAPSQAAPARIVSVGGAVTEILYALGLADRIVGLDVTSLYPPEALRTKPNVGYMRQLSPEGILGLNPQLVVAIDGAGPKETLAVLKDAKVPVMTVPEIFSEQGILDKIGFVADRMGVTSRGACLTAAVSADLASMHALRDKVGDRRRVMFVMSLVSGRAMVAGRHTAADAIIDLAGGINAVADYDGYKPISEEAIVAANPDVILTMQRGADAVTPEAVFANPAFAMTPAARDKSFVAMDGLYLLGFGPRTAAAAHDLAGRLYPALSGQQPWTSRVLSADCRH
ncbi:heme/hemin ABC transporter substrate-binding protein [Bradyrhizobium sp. 2TAF24]|uniref:heme/hemin ABC transporter substrate-binding protein n=1 Tax=Bradyrhizobium sp. 2TAF24 TaxID=3233011 RepID=UPI003F93848A